VCILSINILIITFFYLFVNLVYLFLVKRIDMKESTKVTGCRKCNKGFTKTQIGIVIFSGYVLISSIYGTVMLFKTLLEMF